MTLGERIYRLRNDRNMTQEQLAEKLGVTRQSISKWEGDLVKPEIDKLKAIAKLFEISLDELISDEAGEKTPPETDRLERQIKIYRWVSIITAGLCLIMLVIMIAVSVNLSNRIKVIEQQQGPTGPTVIYPDSDFDDDGLGIESSWEIKNADIKAQTAELHVEVGLDRYSDSTQITAMAETDSGKQYTGQLQSSNGKFKGKVSLPISGDKMKISVVVDNDGEKQKITLDENVYMLDEITVLPTINITTEVTRGITYAGYIRILMNDGVMSLCRNIDDVKVFIENKGKVVSEHMVTDPVEYNRTYYFFKCEEADWEKDFTAGISYYDGNIDKTVKIYGTFDPTNFSDDEQCFRMATEGASYDDNYYIIIK